MFCFAIMYNLFKGVRSDCFRFFFQTFGDFGKRKVIFFSLPLVNFTAGKVYRLEDIKINENVTTFGNHN